MPSLIHSTSRASIRSSLPCVISTSDEKQCSQMKHTSSGWQLRPQARQLRRTGTSSISSRAPASGVSQELFFRSALLPATQLLLKGRPGLALLLHSLLFGLWHIAPLFLGAPIWAVIAVMLVPFLSGIGWGWQVRQDRTVVWAMLQHSLIWVIGLQFAVSG